MQQIGWLEIVGGENTDNNAVDNSDATASLLRRTAAVILAAGASRRMKAAGRGPKLLLDWEGRTILETVIESCVAAGVGTVCVVLGPAAEPAVQQLQTAVEHYRTLLNARFDSVRPPELIIAHNRAPEHGMASSFAVGVEALAPVERFGAVLLRLGDQPAVPPATIRTLARRLLADDGVTAVVQPRYNGKKGHPLLMAPKVAAGAPALRADQQLRELFWPWAEERAIIDIDERGVCVDIDTIDDYEAERPL